VGFRLNNKACLKNTCKCSNGKFPTVCPKDGATACVSCNPGYILDKTKTCLEKKCSCANGIPLTGTKCPSMGLLGCAACNSGFVLGKDGLCGGNVGCTHSAAVNYKATATEDDGSCRFGFLGLGPIDGVHGTCTADITGPNKGPPDGHVNVHDLLMLLGQYGQWAKTSAYIIMEPSIKVQRTNVDDLLTLLSQWHRKCHKPVLNCPDGWTAWSKCQAPGCGRRGEQKRTFIIKTYTRVAHGGATCVVTQGQTQKQFCSFGPLYPCCADQKGWSDKNGNTCAKWGGKTPGNLPCNLAPMMANSKGVSAQQACCACKTGGVG